MSLSNTKEVISTYQLLMEIAQNLAVLAKDPNALEKKIKEAYGLSDELKNQFEQAQRVVAIADELDKANKKQLQKIEDGKKEIQSSVEELDKRKNALAGEISTLAASKRDLQDKESEYDKKLKELSQREQNAAAQEQKNKETLESLLKREKENSDYEARIKEKIKELSKEL